jgi:HTH-type transcriptional regulator/antitoxin HigA
MDQKGLAPSDLVPMIGSRHRVYEVLNRKRPLTLQMIWRLHEKLGIPAESLIKAGRKQAA